MSKPKTPCILYVSSFPPRECGIATFTRRLTDAIDKEIAPNVKSKICAINSNGSSIYNYPRKVIMQINETEMEDYIKRAYDINKRSDIKLVNIQHEYGLFGGEQGEYLMAFLELLKKPFVITMHTVLTRPDEKMRKVGRIISEKSAGVTVMNKAAKELLNKVYGIKNKLIHVIPHGVFDVPFPSKNNAKRKLSLNGRFVISTFGMISRDKGIEYAIEALPEIVKKYPNVLYIIIGATHPQVLKDEGEKYRNMLKRLVVKHKLQDNVKFYNKYIKEKEIPDFLRATDVYVYPMLSREQASSGSLSDAMSCACPTIATKSQFAKSIINHERGTLVNFRNSKQIHDALLDLIEDKILRKEMTKNAYFYTRHMTWRNVAYSYFDLFNHCAKIMPKDKSKSPLIKLDYIDKLTDNFGMIQFANHTKPDLHSGYCVDDNARALIGCIDLHGAKQNKKLHKLINTYLNFLDFSQKSNGRFHNFISYQKTYNDISESDDSFGRAIWALGKTLGSQHLNEQQRTMTIKMFKKAYPHINKLESLRSLAFTITGLSHLYQSEHNDFKDIKDSIINLADKLVAKFNTVSNTQKNAWFWFEDSLTYSNYKLPESLFRAFQITKNIEYKTIAEKSLKFLMKVTFEEKDHFSPIGQDGWYFRNGKRAYFDQQPEDASSAVEALVCAYQTSKKKLYKNKAELAFRWFLGKNHLNQMVYDEATGGCYDGLGKYSLNFNQGAESTLSYFLARLAIGKIE